MVPNLRPPKVGDPVVWYPDANRHLAPTPGIVVQAGENAIDIILHSQYGGHLFKTSVWHLDDPKLQENDFIRKQSGGWGYAPWFQEVLGIIEEARKLFEFALPELNVANRLRSKVANNARTAKRQNSTEEEKAARRAVANANLAKGRAVFLEKKRKEREAIEALAR